MILATVACLIALVLTLLLGIPYLTFLKKKMYGQYIREECPSSHAAKQGTPTMGGVIIILPAIIVSVLVLFMAQQPSIEAFLALITISFFAMAGYRDDIIKITEKHNKGLSAGAKLLLQIAIALLPAFYMCVQKSTEIYLFSDISIDLGWLYPIFAVFLIVGTSNAVNLTDGLDGLAAGTSVFAFAACGLISLMQGRADIAILCFAFAGSCAGFLYFNKFPAKVFMGDTGSLALGGALGVFAVLGKFELWLLPIGIIFFIETLSVMLQVASFKLTGKRIFKMSPIHHHFELCGWKETKVVGVFWTIGALFAILSVIMFFLGVGVV